MTDWSWLALKPLYPEVFLSACGLLLLVLGAFRGDRQLGFITFAVTAAFVGAIALIANADWMPISALGGMVIADGFSSWLKITLLAGLVTSLILSYDWLKENNLPRFEYPLLVLFTGVGMLLMVSATNLMSLYVSLELSSLCLYVLAAIRRDTAASAEAGIKYFVLGALSSGLLLFGISLIYGYTGTTDYDLIGRTLLAHQGSVPTGAVLGMVFLLSGLAFKISAVPFHMWTPDVYEGAPTPVTTLFAIVPKVAAIAMIIRLLVQPFHSLIDDWSQIVIFMSVASMVWGSFGGIVQDNIKRLMAYSAIANIGYALIGVLAAIPEGIASVILYISIYMLMAAGTFGVILCLKRNGQAVEKISDLAGLAKTSPFIAYCLVVLMFSLSGIPPLAGFFSKLFIFQAAVASGYYAVAVIGVLTSVVASYYYLRVIKVMLFDEPAPSLDRDTSLLRRYVVFASVVLILVFCVVPMSLLTQAQAAAGSLFPLSLLTQAQAAAGSLSP
jgi:NADH-quinone oxidoreductase subunit N